VSVQQPTIIQQVQSKPDPSIDELEKEKKNKRLFKG
jgi:hypothetical protein